MNTKHTPGPWKIHTKQVPNGYKFEIEVDLCLIATCYGSTNCMWDFVPGANQGNANARLISAAPDLLEALQLAHATLCGANMNEKVVAKKVMAAIVKATGE